MDRELREHLRVAALGLCKNRVEKELDSLVEDNELTLEQKSEVLKGSNFKVFCDMVEMLYNKYNTGDYSNSIGEQLALQFSVLFEVEDIFDEWRSSHLFPLVDKVKGD
tara:strand:- start:255 stop:578 length:324 start_codon:yes stop_codon:yes gene_type:complete